MKIAAVYIEEFDINNEWYRRMMELISEERAQKVNKLHFAEDKIRSILGEMLIRIHLREAWKMEEKHIQFEYNEFGKPRLQNHPQLHFNISHSGQWVIAAVDECPIGLDVEQIKPIDLDIAERFFAPAEIQYISDQPLERRLTSFYHIWTLKESYIKAVGKGLSIPLDSFSLVPTGDRIILNTLTDGGDWFFRVYEDLSGYALAICSAHNHIPNQIHCLSLAEFQHKLFQFYDE
ncbi:4'-phosphopantetheinyl transferase superfamily protein [Paenibacillus sp. J22TS3]|uniref:4'-phosphopantetheinyl transferase family protein n=1 Tax=Paenibacillus sp. J22TS3 TaxID=2807192 RepID=UPI001B2698CA|nr:4'-phosphopantetheinyl transferase superfamily protein [Paenibacillus sp. J22TS3]GIP23184.1 hypothetical protein J22TS3_34590 [Paenibacillus sp. J22TS3]